MLIARYTVLTLMACCTVIFSGQPRDCKKTMASALALYLCSWVSCASVFVCRLNIIYSGRRSVVGGFAFLLCSCLGASIAIILSGYSFSELPPLWQFPYGPKCYVWVRPHIAALSWLICTSRMPTAFRSGRSSLITCSALINIALQPLYSMLPFWWQH